MTNFSRIYPARNSKLYDKYFSGNKPLTKVLYKALHTAEIVPYGIRGNQPIPVTNDKPTGPAMTRNADYGGQSRDQAISSPKSRTLPLTAKKIEENK